MYLVPRFVVCAANILWHVFIAPLSLHALSFHENWNLFFLGTFKSPLLEILRLLPMSLVVPISTFAMDML